MSWLGKMIGGTIGLALGGPLGAVAGAAFGHAFVDRREDEYLRSIPGSLPMKRRSLFFSLRHFPCWPKSAKQTAGSMKRR